MSDHFFRETERALPEWRGRHATHLANGLRAIGVIHLYLAPLWAVFVWLALSRGFVPGATSAWIALAVAALPIFTNVALPWLVVAASLLGPDGAPLLTGGEAAALLVGFHAAIFCVPAGFMRVSATGRFRAAFALHRTLPFVARRLPDFLAAWWYGLWMNGAAVALAPLRPWSFFWAYIASQAVFNQLLEDVPADPARGERPRGAAWLARARALAPGPGPGRLRGLACPTPWGGRARVLRTPFFSVPLP